MNEVNDQDRKDLEDAQAPVVDEHLLAQLEELRAKLDVAEAGQEIELGEDELAKMRGKLDMADQSPLPRGPFPDDYKSRPDESTKNFMHRGLNASGAGVIGVEAEALRASLKEDDTAEFLRKVGPVIMDEQLSIDSVPAPLGEWIKALDNRQLAEVRLARLYAQDFAHGTVGHHRLMLIAQLADLLDQGDPVEPKPDPLTISRHVLDVQYHSQHEYDAQLTRRDCGPACIEMVGEHLRPAVEHSTDEIMVRITKGVDRSTYISELQAAALEMFQVTLHRVEQCSMTQLRDWILEDKPVIILVHYGSFHTRLDRNYRAGHFMVVAGYEVIDYQGTPSMRFFIHDPDYYHVRTGADVLPLFDQGAFIPVTEKHLHAMWSDAVNDRNPERMALVPEIM